MNKTQITVSIEPEQLKWLKRTAHELERSIAWLVRRIISKEMNKK